MVNFKTIADGTNKINLTTDLIHLDDKDVITTKHAILNLHRQIAKSEN